MEKIRKKEKEIGWEGKKWGEKHGRSLAEGRSLSARIAGSRALLKTKEDFGHGITEELVSPGYGPPSEPQTSSRVLSKEKYRILS